VAKRIFRSEKDKMIGGVCSGLARYFNIDVVLVRLFWVLLLLLQGSGVLAYIIAWIIIPAENNVQYDFPASENEEFTVEEENSFNSNSSQGNKIAGLILIGAGVFLLLRMYIPMYSWRRLWPLILIIAGIFIALQGRHGGKK
jgi:phage shock protein C